MTYDQFWNQDVELVKAYQEADRIKRDLKNQDMWMQGAYYYEALLDVAPVLRFSLSKKPPKPIPYRDQPIDIHTGARKQEEKPLSVEAKSDKKAKAMMEMFMVSINKKFEKKGGERNG
nr:MAG TPA: hypothetical protein [Caudoviricetes sp.]